jgi:hypothetical protein
MIAVVAEVTRIGSRLAQRGEDQRVGAVGAGHFEVVGTRVRGHALEQELTEVRVLAFVAIEGDLEQSGSDRSRSEHRSHQ